MNKQQQIRVKPRRDLIGQKFGRLTVIEQADDYVSPQGIRRTKWKCQCSCEKQTILEVTQNALLGGKTLSCGCYGQEQIAKRISKHFKTQTRLFNVWNNIKRRCYTKTNPSYKYYGGIGIKMCDEWHYDFQYFYDWAYANGYDDSLEFGKCTLDRIDNNGNYEPSNCRWVTMEEQSLNKHDTHFLEYKGVKKPLTIWSREKGINPSTLLYRLKRGWSVEKAIETKVVKNG